MALTVKHSFVSTIPDGTDATKVRPSNWNADHVITGSIAATPADPVNSVQFNNAGALGGSDLFTFDGTKVQIGSVDTAAYLGVQSSLETTGKEGVVSVIHYALPDNGHGLTVGDFEVIIHPSSTVTYPEVIALYLYAQNEGSGNVSALDVMYLDSVINSGSGVIANVCGLHIFDQTVGTNNWAIKTGLGLVEFGDKVHIGPAESTLPAKIQNWVGGVGGSPLLVTSSGAHPAIRVEASGDNVQGINVILSPTAGGGFGAAIEADVSIAVGGVDTYGFGSYGEVEIGIAAQSFIGFHAWDFFLDSGASLVNLYGLKIEDQVGATNNWAIKTGKGLVEFGAAGDAAGTVGLHIMGKGAFDSDSFGNPAGLWIDMDTNAPYSIALTNRTAGANKYSAIYIADDGSFTMDVAGGFASLYYHAVANSWEIAGGSVLVPSLTTTALTVATLPASPVAGQRAFVTDSNAVSMAVAFGAVVATGGSTGVPVVYDGANWRVG